MGGITGSTAIVTGAGLSGAGTALSPLLNKGIGFAQNWSDVTTSRSFNTTYTNNLSVPITVNFTATTSINSVSRSYVYGVVNGLTVVGTQCSESDGITLGAILESMTFIVPAGQTYQIQSTNVAQKYIWSELV